MGNAPKQASQLDRAAAEQIARTVCQKRGLAFVRFAGEGAFKFTFEADAAGTRKALKVYRTPGAVNERQRREVEAMSRCNHPNIARLDVVDIEAGAVFSIEEFLAGDTLAARLTANPALTRAETLELGDTLLGAVEHIESRRLVHRDLKPENIMFRADGTPVVVDFGIVRDLTQVSVTQTWAPQGPGTPFYAAPEQLNNQKQMIDWRTDQFSLGVVLAIARFGEHPYATPNTTPVDVVSRVAARGAPSQAFTDAAAKDGLQCLIRMIDPWPVGRYRLPAELIQAWRAQT